MSKKKLTNLEDVKKIVEEYLKLTKPTLSGLCRKFKVTWNTLYRAMDEENEIGEHLRDAYMFLVQKHEEGLYEKICSGHMFWLRSIRKYIDFSDNDTVLDQSNISKRFTLQIIEADA